MKHLVNRLRNFALKHKFLDPFLFIWRRVHIAFSRFQGRQLLKMFLKNKKPDEIYIVSAWHMGDSLYTLSSLQAMLKHYPDKKFVVVGNSKYENLFNSYDTQNRVRFWLLPPTYEHIIIWLMLDKKLWKQSAAQEILFAWGIPADLQSGDDNHGGIHALRKIVLKLPEDSPISYHNLQRVPVTSIKNFDDIKHKTVIINPYSLSMGHNMDIYNNLCKELLSRGCEVFTNVVGEQEAAEGSRPLRCSIEELYSIACEIPLIVSVRSGILDLIAPSNINMFVVYEVGASTDITLEVASLKEWKCSGKIKEVVITQSDDKAVVTRELSSFIDELKAEGRLS